MSLIPEPRNVDFDDLEKGFLKAYPRDVFTPHKDSELRRTVLEVNKQKTSCRLKADPSMEFLLEADYNSKTQTWEIYSYNACKARRPKEACPIAYMKPHMKDQWALWSATCQHCDSNYHFDCINSSSSKSELREQLMLIENGVENLQDSIMYTMNVIMPPVDENNNRKVVWCPRQYPRVKSSNRDSYIIKDFNKRRTNGAEDDCLNLSTVKPRWNEIQQAYCIDFGGRITKNSKRNLQIQETDGDRTNVLCQFGKRDHNVYVLDYKSPLSLIHALGIAIAALHWE